MIQRPLRFGALFAGYGGLEDGVQSVLGGVLAWYSEYEPPAEKNPRPSQAAARIMAYHHPGVPNLGDINRTGRISRPRREQRCARVWTAR